MGKVRKKERDEEERVGVVPRAQGERREVLRTKKGKPKGGEKKVGNVEMRLGRCGKREPEPSSGVPTEV